MELGHHTAVMLYAQQLEALRWLPCAAKAGWRTYNSVKGLHFHFETLCNSTHIIKVMLHSLKLLSNLEKLQQLEASGHKSIALCNMWLNSLR
jgi:hypothetical protein